MTKKMEILPCPFCGTTPNILPEASVFEIPGPGKFASIHCFECGFFLLGKISKRTHKSATKEVIKMWNRREVVT